jgi:spore germination protein GerM
MTRWRAIGLLVAALVAGCGVPEDSAPEELSADEVPFDLLTPGSTTTTVPPPIDLPPDRRAELWFLVADEFQLEPVVREVADQNEQTVIQTLLSTSDLEQGLSTAIPPDTELLDAFVDDGLLTVDLSNEFTDIQGDSAIAAVAQIVYTADGLNGVSEVLFRVEGEDFPVTDEEGAIQEDPVSRLDYQSLAPD